MATGTIVIALPDDRTQLGTISLVNDSGVTIAGPFDCYGKADNAAAAAHDNPDRSPFLPYGDTPLGNYTIPGSGIVATGDGTSYNSHAYGSAGAMVLVPTGGDALLAAENGRAGIMIHSGDLNAAGELRPTNGCIRVGEDDLNSIFNAFDNLSGNCTCEAVSLSVEISRPRGGDDEPGAADAGDPPPGISDIIDPEEPPDGDDRHVRRGQRLEPQADTST